MMLLTPGLQSRPSAVVCRAAAPSSAPRPPGVRPPSRSFRRGEGDDAEYAPANRRLFDSGPRRPRLNDDGADDFDGEQDDDRRQDRRRDPQERREGWEGRERQEGREGQEGRERREGWQGREEREGREGREVWEGREGREGRERREGREGDGWGRREGRVERRPAAGRGYGGRRREDEDWDEDVDGLARRPPGGRGGDGPDGTWRSGGPGRRFGRDAGAGRGTEGEQEGRQGDWGRGGARRERGVYEREGAWQGRDGSSRGSYGRPGQARPGSPAAPGAPFDGPQAASGSGAAAPAAPAAPAVKPAPLPVVRANDGDKGTFFDSQTFKQIGASTEVLAALRELGITRPSHIQAESFRLLSKPSPSPSSRHVALMDQAGSGKTLAYLLPMLQQLKQEELDKGTGPVAQPGQPRLVVLAPTTELVQQVYRVVKALSNAGLRFRSACMTGGHEDRDKRSKTWRTQVSQLKDGIDVLIATPGRVVSHLNAGTMSLASCKAVVLDEVDVLLGDQAAFRDQVDPVRDAAPPSLRFVLVTATLPQHTLAQLRLDFPDLTLASGPGLHRTAAGLEEELVDCSGGDVISLEAGIARKLEALTKVLSKRGAARVIVFCNKIESCRDVENHLKRSEGLDKRYKVVVYHEAIRDELRTEALNTFLQPVKPAELPVILVATDRMSRGIDTMFCEHVVLFDFPRDPSEYVRRVGRTARGAGGRGTVSVLVMGRQVPLARDIMDKNQKGKPIHRLPDVLM